MTDGTFVGMDVAAVRTVASQMSSQSQHLAAVLHAVDTLVADTGMHWLGHSAATFRDHWHSGLRHRLDAAVQQLATMARVLMSNAAEQDKASASHGAAASVGAANRQGGHVRDPLTLVDAAAAGYRSDATVPGFHQASSAELKKLGITSSMLSDPRSGFKATVLMDDSGRYIVSFGGTDGVDGPDWLADGEGATYLSRQTEEALSLARLVSLGVGPDDVTFTGHSLGGRLAALSSVATGAPAATFNAAGVSDSELLYARTLGDKPQSLASYAVTWPVSLIGMGATVTPFGGVVNSVVGAVQNVEDHVGVRGEYQQQITNYTSRFDPLTGIQENSASPNALGHTVDVGGPPGVHAHDLATVRSALEQREHH